MEARVEENNTRKEICRLIQELRKVQQISKQEIIRERMLVPITRVYDEYLDISELLHKLNEASIDVNRCVLSTEFILDVSEFVFAVKMKSKESDDVYLKRLQSLSRKYSENTLRLREKISRLQQELHELHKELNKSTEPEHWLKLKFKG